MDQLNMVLVFSEYSPILPVEDILMKTVCLTSNGTGCSIQLRNQLDAHTR